MTAPKDFVEMINTKYSYVDKGYIETMPILERLKVCDILDNNNVYEELAEKYMHLKPKALKECRLQQEKGMSPTDHVLRKWGFTASHTVDDLFCILITMRQYEAMDAIQHLVDPRLIPDREEIERQKGNIEVVNWKGEVRTEGKKGVEEKEVKILNGPPEEYVTRDDNVTQKNANNYFQPNATPLERLSSKVAVSDVSCVVESAGGIPHIPYEELQAATRDWDTRSILGRGGFGTVYRGTWKYTQVAIKRIELRKNDPESHDEQMRQSITEMHCLNAYRHDNILPLYAYSMDGPQPCLIYQYMSGGNLERRLRIDDPERALSWSERMDIAVGTARGLQFLHKIRDKPLIHGDIKSANILLDTSNVAKIGDFGLAKEGPQAQYTHMQVTRVHGTRPYLPEEFLRGKKFSTKVDVYSFGVVLFEIATGLVAASERRELKFLKDHVMLFEGDVGDLRDTRARGNSAYFDELIATGKQCVSQKPKDRPGMEVVFSILERAFLRHKYS